MTYVLATTEDIVRWYSFDLGQLSSGAPCHVLLDVLDMNAVPLFADKETAKRAALALGLKTCRYVRL